jgi:hypothetical protein
MLLRKRPMSGCNEHDAGATGRSPLQQPRGQCNQVFTASKSSLDNDPAACLSRKPLLM